MMDQKKERIQLINNMICMSGKQLDKLEELVRAEVCDQDTLEIYLKLIKAVRDWKEKENDIHTSQAAD